MKHVVIPKKIKSKEKELTLYLKTDIEGVYFKGDIQEFICTTPLCKFHIEADTTSEVINQIRRKIINIYLKGIDNFDSLNTSELNLFYYIDDVHSTQKYKNNTLIIGYKDNYLNDIKITTLKFNTSCDHIELSKNIEICTDRNYEIIFDNISNQIKKKKYNNFIIDITNIFINEEYNHTKSLIEYIESINGKILFLTEHSLIVEYRFLTIFGKKYKDNIVYKDDYIRPGKNTLRKIKKILFD